MPAAASAASASATHKAAPPCGRVPQAALPIARRKTKYQCGNHQLAATDDQKKTPTIVNLKIGLAILHKQEPAEPDSGQFDAMA